MSELFKNLKNVLFKNNVITAMFSVYSFFYNSFDLFFKKLNTSSFVKRLHNFYKEHPKMDIFFLIIWVIFVSFILFHRFIFGKEVFLFNELDFNKDQICNYYPYLEHIFHHKGGLSFWSFNSGMGNNMFPMINQFFLDPFNIINAIFWNPMENGFIYMLILKLICISIIFYRLALIFTENRYVSFLVAFLFSFNGFIMFMGQHWGMVNKVFAFVFLLYSIEIYFKSKNKWWLILLALTIMISDFYFFYQSIFFVGFYLLFRNLYNEGNFRQIPIQVLKISIFTIIGGLLASIIILPIIHVLGNGPRITLNNFDLDKLIFSLNDFDYYLSLFGMYFSNNLNGNATNFFGWNDLMRSPILYSGLLTLLILPQLFFIKNTNQKRALIFISIISIITVIFPFFGYLFNGFQELYFRWTYGIITMNLLSVAIILNAILKEKILNFSVLKITLGILFFGLLLFWMYYRRHDGEWKMNELIGAFYEDKNHYLQGRLLIIFSFLFIYFILLHFINKYKWIVFILLLLFNGIELIFEHYPTFYSRGLVQKDRNPYRSQFALDNEKLINEIKQKDKTPFYRIEQQYYLFGTGLTRNASMMYDFKGLKSYTSLNPKSTYDFCLFFNMIKSGHWPNILPSWEPNIERYSLLNILSVKYLMSKEKILINDFELLNKLNKIYVYKNKKSIPFGFSFQNFISKSKINLLVDSIKDSLVNSTLILEDKDVKKLKPYFGKGLKVAKMDITKFSNVLIKGYCNSKTKRMLYFSIPFDDGWVIKVNGKIAKFYKVNIGFIGLPIDKGNNDIELTYSPPMFKRGLIISLTTLIICILFFIFRRKGRN